MEKEESERQFPVFIVKLKVKVSGKRQFPLAIVKIKEKDQARDSFLCSL